MDDTAVLERETTATVQRNLINLQNEKNNLITPITRDAAYLRKLLTEKNPNKIAEIRDIMIQVEQKIEEQYKTAIKAQKEGINISNTIRTALYNELVVCKEIKTKLDDIPRLIEKLDELERKIARTMAEIRTNE